MVDAFVESHESAPEEMVLDLERPAGFFHGCTTVFATRGSICCRPRCYRWGRGRWSWRIVGRIRQGRGPISSGPTGFCRDDLIRWCEDHHGLRWGWPTMIGSSLDSGRNRGATGAGVQGFPLPGHSWTSRRQGRRQSPIRRHLPVAGSLPARSTDFYCALENRIKEQQLGLFADRTRGNDARQSTPAAVLRRLHATPCVVSD